MSDEETPDEVEDAPSPSKFVEAPGLVSEVAAAADAERDRLAEEAGEDGTPGQNQPEIQTPLYAEPPTDGADEDDTADEDE